MALGAGLRWADGWITAILNINFFSNSTVSAYQMSQEDVIGLTEFQYR